MTTDTPEEPRNDEDAPKARAKGPAAAPPPRAPLAELGMGAAWLVGLSAASLIVGALIPSNVLAAAVLQALVVDLGAGRAGVRWDPAADEKGGIHYGNAARRIAIGAGAALGVTALVIGAGAAMGWAKVSAHGPTISLAYGVIRSIAFGVRDGLLYAGLPLYFVGRAKGTPKVAGVVFGALAAGAAIALQPQATPAGVTLAVAVAAAVAAFWAHDGVGWAALGVAAGFPLFAGSVLRGGLVDVDWEWGKGLLAPGLKADGAPAWIAAAGFLAMAGVLVWKARGRVKGTAVDAPVEGDRH